MFHTPDKREKTRRSYRPAPGAERQNRALKHIQSGLVPANPGIVQLIENGLKSPDYDASHFLSDLAKDPGCLIHVFKNLNKYADQVDSGINPLQLIRGLQRSSLIELSRSLSKNSFQSFFDTINHAQARELQFSIASSVAARTLSEKIEDLDSEQCAIGCIFRQLGRYLVAWNYPRTYNQIQKLQQDQGVPVDQSIKEQLGVSPLEIMMHIAGLWNLDGNIRAYCRSLPEQSQSIEQPLEALLFAAELFAETRDQQLYPESQATWDLELGSLERFLPQVDLDLLEERCTGALKELAESSSRKIRFPFLQSRALERREPRESAGVEIHSNPFIRKLPEELSKCFIRVYEKLNLEELPLTALRYLVEEAIPASGFQRGCVFLLRSQNYSLKPALRVGALKLYEYGNLIDDRGTGILDSLSSNIPLISSGTGVLSDSRERTLIVGSLQSNSHPGVLYLEADMPESLVTGETVLFHCIRATVNDCFAHVAGEL